MTILILDCPFVPISVNALYRVSRGRMYKTARFRELRVILQSLLDSDWKIYPLDQKLSLSIEVYYSDRRSRDIDNCLKCLLDLCNGTVWADDSQISQIEIVKLSDSHKHTKLFVQPYGRETNDESVG